MPRLSLCIATYNRAKFLGPTLDSILMQLPSDCELVIVDGSSPDNTPQVVAGYLQRHPGIRYFREIENSGIDRDYDKAVRYANGEYCWLMTDDDLLRPGAIERVLAEIADHVDLVVVNSEVKNVDLSETLEERRLAIYSDKEYGKDNNLNSFFADAGSYLSFIGAVVIRREAWLERERAPYYGTLFIHVGVIFQHPPIHRIKVIADPLITIRYGNAMWTPRGFEIWMFKWPHLIWSFPDFSKDAKEKICHQEPWKNQKMLIYYRGTGAYSSTEFRKFLARIVRGMPRISSYMISLAPARFVNLVLVAYYSMPSRAMPMVLYDLLHSRHAGLTSRLLARWAGITVKN